MIVWLLVKHREKCMLKNILLYLWKNNVIGTHLLDNIGTLYTIQVFINKQYLLCFLFRFFF